MVDLSLKYLLQNAFQSDYHLLSKKNLILVPCSLRLSMQPSQKAVMNFKKITTINDKFALINNHY